MYRLSTLRRRLAKFVVLSALLLTPAGCSKGEIDQAIDQARAQTQALTETAVAKVEEHLPATGNIRLDLSPVVESDQAEIEVILIGDGRPNVVQIANYDTSSDNRPSTAILFHGTTTAENSRALAGQSVECDMYLQASANAPIAISKAGESVTLIFDSFNEQDGTLTARLDACELIASDDRLLRLGGGQLTAVVLD